MHLEEGTGVGRENHHEFWRAKGRAEDAEEEGEKAVEQAAEK